LKPPEGNIANPPCGGFLAALDKIFSLALLAVILLLGFEFYRLRL
jgi:hypothetical protein